MHKLLQGDCIELLHKIPNDSIDLILTDIPFNISKDNNFKTMKDRTGRNGIDFGEWDKDFDESCLSQFVPKLKKGGSLVVFHSFEQYNLLLDIFDGKLIHKDRFVWEKTNPMPRNRDRRYVSNIELCSWFVKGGAKWTFNRQNSSYDGCVLRYPSESGGGFKRYHPCQKNVKMLEELIKRHSNTNDIVLDPFMGSGSTGVACLNTGRNFIGMELDESYFNVASQRIGDVANSIDD
jgi:site-specific DNA-methyltransferase (adenine-specific)